MHAMAFPKSRRSFVSLNFLSNETWKIDLAAQHFIENNCLKTIYKEGVGFHIYSGFTRHVCRNWLMRVYV